MNADWNTAEREQQVNGPSATLEQCCRMGQTHRAYNWTKSPSGAWNAQQLEAYERGYSK